MQPVDAQALKQAPEGDGNAMRSMGPMVAQRTAPLPAWAAARWRRGLGLGPLGQVVRHAHQRPLGSRADAAAQQEPAKTSIVLQRSYHRLHDLHASRVHRLPLRRPHPICHPPRPALGQRHMQLLESSAHTTRLRLRAPGAPVRPIHLPTVPNPVRLQPMARRTPVRPSLRHPLIHARPAPHRRHVHPRLIRINLLHALVRPVGGDARQFSRTCSTMPGSCP